MKSCGVTALVLARPQASMIIRADSIIDVATNKTILELAKVGEMSLFSQITGQTVLLVQTSLTVTSDSSIEDIFKQISFYLASGVEAAAAIIIGLAALQATFEAFLLFFTRHDTPDRAKEDIRLKLGRWLGVALEFEVGADILRTAIAPSWNEVGLLAAIVILRTILNFFLQKEIQNAESGGGNL